jgi:DNA gyrase subunit A
MATRHGLVKKTSLDQYDTSRRDGIIAISLNEEDQLVDVKLTSGEEQIVLATKRGQAIRFLEEQVRPMGRNTRGVRGISLAANDEVVGMETVRPDAYLLTVTANGFGKRTLLTAIPRPD